MRRSHNVTREALIRVRSLLEQVDDTIYRDAQRRGLADNKEDFTYTEDEVKLSTIIDEAQGEVTKMMAGL
jgi:hypothetical protein